MTPELDALARRAVACPRWRWLPGMRTLAGSRVTVAEDEGAYILVLPTGWGQQILPDDPGLPDLTDPATLGCLLALVREAWGQDTWVQHENEWTCFVVLDDQLDHYCGTSEAEALVAALEVGP